VPDGNVLIDGNFRKKIHEGFRPSLERIPAKQAVLIDRMWSSDQDERPPMSEAVRVMRYEKDLWFTGPSPKKFDEHRIFLDRADTDAVFVSRPAWKNDLSQTSSFNAFEAEFGCGDFTDLLSQTHGFLTGSPEAVNDRVRDVVRNCLLQHNCLAPIVIGSQLHELEADAEGPTDIERISPITPE
jgi:hypothetical protein